MIDIKMLILLIWIKLVKRMMFYDLWSPGVGLFPTGRQTVKIKRIFVQKKNRFKCIKQRWENCVLPLTGLNRYFRSQNISIKCRSLIQGRILSLIQPIVFNKWNPSEINKKL